MVSLRVLGLFTTFVGLVGYLAGVLTPYPGRAFTVTLIMIGITAAAVGATGGDAVE